MVDLPNHDEALLAYIAVGLPDGTQQLIEPEALAGFPGAQVLFHVGDWPWAASDGGG